MSGQGQGVTPGAYLWIQQRSALSYHPTALLTGSQVLGEELAGLCAARRAGLRFFSRML